MKPYSQDLRERVIAALEAGDETQADIAERFCLSKSTVEKWWYRWQATDSCAALPPGHGPARALQVCETFIRAEIARQPDVTLGELCERVAEQCTVSASRSAMGRTVQRLNLPRKKDASRQSAQHAARDRIATRLCRSCSNRVERLAASLAIHR